MQIIEKITEVVSLLIKEKNILLYEIELENQSKSKILRIAVMFEDGSMDIDTCSVLSEEISEKLDELDIIDGEYFLEVCSAGIERKLKSKDEVINQVGKHLYIDFIESKEGFDNIQGELMSFKDDTFTTLIFIKGRKKLIQWKYEDAALIRLAIKF